MYKVVELKDTRHESVQLREGDCYIDAIMSTMRLQAMILLILCCGYAI